MYSLWGDYYAAGSDILAQKYKKHFHIFLIENEINLKMHYLGKDL